MRIGIIGAGSVGAALGAGWLGRGRDVLFGVRNPVDPEYAELGADRVHTVAEATSDAGIIVLATPWAAARDALSAAGDVTGKIIVDCTNPLAFSAADGLHLAVGFTTSGAEQVQSWSPGASVFKTLNQTGAEGMRDAGRFAAPPVMFVAGDDEERKPEVLSLVAELGFDALDAGPLSGARLLEPLAMLWIDLALNRGLGRDFAFALTRPAP